MMLTHEYWMKHFGGDRRGRPQDAAVDDKAVTIVGVLQAAPTSRSGSTR